MKKTFIHFILFTGALYACNSRRNTADNAPETVKVTPLLNFSVTGVYPHDTTAYTEGLLMHNDTLFESTGYTNELPQTKSLFGELDLKTGKIMAKVTLDTSQYFGEGIAFLNNKWYQLTYRTKVGFVYDGNTFKQLQVFDLPVKEGWGLTTDSVQLIISDGTDAITFADPLTFAVAKKIHVTDENGLIMNLNELEYINGFIYANIYGTPYIVKIDPASGNVTGKLDLGYLARGQKNKFPGAMQMNGIAYNPATGKLYVTGKMWPNIYELQFIH